MWVVVVLAALLRLLCNTAPVSCSPADSIHVELSETPISQAIPPNFASFSIEISDCLAYLGQPDRLSRPWINLMNLLRSATGERGPSIRIGGNSADTSLWWASQAPLPPNQTYAITHVDLETYQSALPQWNGYAVVDTSLFLQDNVSWAVAHVAAVDRYLGWQRVEGVEIGNEPEGYNGREGYRPRSWTPQDYEQEFYAHVLAMQGAGMPTGRVQGAVFGGNDKAFNAEFANYTSTFARLGVLASVSRHYYSLDGCGGKAAPTLAQLLDNGASAGAAVFLAPYAAAAATAGIPFRVGEGNSVNCGGAKGVSDVFGAALYALDVMLHLAALNASQWNWHGGPHNVYSPINVVPPSLVPIVKPLFYGIWAMTVASANHSRLMACSVTSSNPLVKVWALAEQTGTRATRVVIIHKDANATGPAAVSITPAAGQPRGRGTDIAPARLVRLTAPRVTDSHGVTFGGLSFDGTEDGVPAGAPDVEPVPFSDGVYSFSVPPGTAAIFQIIN